MVELPSWGIMAVIRMVDGNEKCMQRSMHSIEF